MSSEKTSNKEDSVVEKQKTTAATVRSPSNKNLSEEVSPAGDPESCYWCSEKRVNLKFAWSIENVERYFCTQNCVVDYRKARKKSPCHYCREPVKATSPGKFFCSRECIIKSKENCVPETDTQTTTDNTSSSPATKTPVNSNNKSIEKGLDQENKNDDDINNNSGDSADTMRSGSNNVDSSTGKDGNPQSYTVNKGGSVFLYESFSIFDWKEYLEVSRN